MIKGTLFSKVEYLEQGLVSFLLEKRKLQDISVLNCRR